MLLPDSLRAPIRYLRFRGQALSATLSDLLGGAEAPDGLALPPPLLRHRVHGAFDAGSYLAVSERVAADVRELLHSVGCDLRSTQRVLDFGCGSGRLLRKLRDLPGELHGTDIDSEAIDWCRKHLPHVKSAVNGASPPTHYPDEFFDCVCAISVFTHLNEEAQFAWLEELRRITKPGGVLLLSVHGETARRHYPQEEKSLVGDDRPHFIVKETGLFNRSGLPDFYQDAQHTKVYVERAWSRHFEVLRYVEAGINSHQDAVLLGR